MSQKQQPSSKEDVQQKKTEKDIIRARDQLAKQHKPSKNELITSDDQNKKNLPTREGGGPNSPPVKERHVPDFVSQSKINNTSFSNNNSIVAKPGSFSKKTSVDGVPEPPQVVAAASLQQQQQNASTTMKITNKLKAARESHADSSSNKKSEDKHNNTTSGGLDAISAVSPDPIPRGEGPPLPLAEKEKERERKERKQKAREEKERERRHMSPDDDEDDANNDAKSEPRSHRSSQHHHHHHSQKDKKDKKDKKEHKKEKHGDRENGDSEQQKNSNDNNTDKDKKRKNDKKYYNSTDGEGDRQHSASSDRQPSVQDVVNHFNNLTVEQQQQLLLLQQQREREKMQHPSQRNNNQNNSSEGETYQNNNNTTSSENEAVKNSSFVQNNNNNQVSGRASGNPSPALSNNVPNNSFASVPNTSFAINNNNNMNNGSFGINNNNNGNASFATQQSIVPNNSFVVGSNNNNNNLMFGNNNLKGIENIFPPGSKDERKTKLLMAQLRSIQAELEATLYESTSSGPEEYNSASEQEQKQLQQNIRNEEQQQQMNLYGIFHPNFKRETSKMERQVMDQIEIDLQQRLKNARSLSGGEYSRDSDNSRSQSALFHPPAAGFVNHADNSNNGNFTGKVDTIEGSHSYHYHNQQSKSKDKELWQAASSTKEQRDSRSSSQLAQYPEFATSSSLRPPPVTYDRFGVTIKNNENDNNQSSVVSTLSPRGSKYMSGAAQHENQATQDIVDSWRTRPVGLSRRQQILQSEKVHLTTVLADIQRSFDVDHFAGKTSLRKDPNEASPLRDREVKQAILMRSSHLLAAQRTLGTAVRDRELRHRLLLEAIRDLPSSNEGGVAGDSSTNIASLLSLHLSS